MRRNFYWPTMMADIRRCTLERSACARVRTKLRSHAAPIKLFPAQRPLNFVAVDLLGPLPTSVKGFQFILAMNCRYSNPTRAIPLRSITATSVAQALVDHCAHAPSVR